MIYTIIVLFALTAVMGLIVAVAIFNKKPETPKVAVYVHGALAATSLVLLFLYRIDNPDHFPMISLVLFLVGALGGFYLFYNDVARKTPGPLGVIVAHALIGVTAFVLLLAFAFL